MFESAKLHLKAQLKVKELNQCEKKKNRNKFQLTNPPLSIIHVANLSLKYRSVISFAM